MKKIVECIPNFSEGRDAQKIDLIAKAIASVDGVAVLDRTMDADHHRSVITFAGEPQGVMLAAIRAAATAVELIDLNHHSGEHPRMGALDVLPFVPIKNVTMEECVDLARKAGERIAEELGIPVFLYEQAATRPDRVDLANVRRGGFEAIREEILFHPDRKPDFGPRQIHQTAGAMAVGARNPLIAFNINLATEDLVVAKKIAKAVRGSSGGLQNVKALAMQLKNRHQAQVSMNLVNYEATPIFRAFDLVRREAERFGVAITSSEIVGLVPQSALNACSEFYLQIENFSEDLVLENRLHAALADSFPEIGAGFREDAAIEEADILDSEMVTTSSSTALPQTGQTQSHAIDAQQEFRIEKITPESGSVAAYTGILATQLAVTVAEMTASHKPSVADEITAMLDRLEQLSDDLQLAVKEDVEGRERVLDAMALPRETDAEKLARSMAIEQASKNAVAVPLRIAESAMQVLETLSELYEMGNASGFSDLSLSAQLAVTAIRGAAYNILPGVMNISDQEFAEDCRAQIMDLLESGNEVANHIEEFFLRLYPTEN